MGGYGALRNGLKYSDTFGYIVNLSGALLTETLDQRTNDSPFFLERRSYAEACFGDLSKVTESDMDPKYLVKQLEKAGKPLPHIYMACGDKDSLLGVNQDMADFLRQHHADVTFEVGPGAHEWDFWDTYIYKAIQWLPTEKNTQGINSGNVGV